MIRDFVYEEVYRRPPTERDDLLRVRLATQCSTESLEDLVYWCASSGYPECKRRRDAAEAELLRRWQIETDYGLDQPLVWRVRSYADSLPFGLGFVPLPS